MDRLSAKDILERYKTGEVTPEEKAMVEDWIVFGDFQDIVFTEEELQGQLKAIEKGLPLVVYGNARRFWLRVASAAAVLLLSVSVGYYYAGRNKATHSLVTSKAEPVPGGNRATLTLANGRTINLSGNQSGVVVNAAQLSYSDGSLIEKEASSPHNGFHTVSTPRGGQYQVVLPDSTHVWLNANSSLKFPESFDQASSRRVTLTGEAYFDVAVNVQQPFVVETKDQRIDVLGTQFNINCYEDEDAFRTTLLTGSVRVTNSIDQTSGILKPGQQAILNGKGMRIEAGNTDEAIAWKAGYFDFRNEPLEKILRQVSRWYDVDIVYEGNKVPQELLYGRISRSKSLSAVLKVLELSSEVSFKMEGKKLTVVHK